LAALPGDDRSGNINREQDMKHFVVAWIICAVAAVGVAGPLPEYPFVYAEGEATAELKPDVCTIRFQIDAVDQSPDAALVIVEKRSAEVLAMLAEHKIPNRDIVAFEITKKRVRDWENREALVYLGYSVERQVEVTLRDLSHYEAVTVALLKAESITGIRSRFDRTDREEIESRLISEAVSAARARAERMTEGAGQRIVSLRAISQSGFHNLNERFGLGEQGYASYFSGDDDDGKLLFVPAIIEFKSAVSVIYEITADE
jgi:uncharacterized protein YggE